MLFKLCSFLCVLNVFIIKSSVVTWVPQVAQVSDGPSLGQHLPAGSAPPHLRPSAQVSRAMIMRSAFGKLKRAHDSVPRRRHPLQ